MTDRKMEERRKGEEAEWVRGTVRKGKKGINIDIRGPRGVKEKEIWKE